MDKLKKEKNYYFLLEKAKTKTEYKKVMAQVPIKEIYGSKKELSRICREKVCSYCGGKLNLDLITNGGCCYVVWRAYHPACRNCSRMEWGVKPELYKKAMSFVKKYDYRRLYGKSNYTGYGKGKRYDYYELGCNIHHLIDLWEKMKRHFK